MWRLHRDPATAAAPPPPLLPRRDVGESCVTLISSISLATFFSKKTLHTALFASREGFSRMQSVTQAFGYTLRKYSGLTLVLTGFTECRVSEPIHMLYSVGVKCA